MNPIQEFESAIENIWKGDLTSIERVAQLYQVSESIKHYLSRVQPPERETTDRVDIWKSRRRARARAYLEHVARDCQELIAQEQNSLQLTSSR